MSKTSVYEFSGLSVFDPFYVFPSAVAVVNFLCQSSLLMLGHITSIDSLTYVTCFSGFYVLQLSVTGFSGIWFDFLCLYWCFVYDILLLFDALNILVDANLVDVVKNLSIICLMLWYLIFSVMVCQCLLMI